MKLRFAVSLAAILASNIAAAHDYAEQEGHFYNASNTTMMCYKDSGTAGPDGETDHVCESPIEPGNWCNADAMGTKSGSPVFKIPNVIYATCTVGQNKALICHFNDVSSKIIEIAARVKNGLGGYGTMPWQHFVKIMGDKPVRRCAASEMQSKCPMIKQNPFGEIASNRLHHYGLEMLSWFDQNVK